LLGAATADRISGTSEVTLWDLQANQRIASLGKSALVGQMAFSNDGEVLLTANRDGTIQVYDVARREELSTLQGHTEEVTALAFTADDKRLASASHDKTIKLWDVATGQELLTLRGYGGEFTDVAFSPDGRCLAAACADQTIRVWTAPELPPTSRGSGATSARSRVTKLSSSNQGQRRRPRS
jgi:WD40 repeat protein